MIMYWDQPRVGLQACVQRKACARIACSTIPGQLRWPMDDPEVFLAWRGWKATLTQTGEKDANYGRWPYPVIPRTIPDTPRNWFVTAQKQ